MKKKKEMKMKMKKEMRMKKGYIFLAIIEIISNIEKILENINKLIEHSIYIYKFIITFF